MKTMQATITRVSEWNTDAGIRVRVRRASRDETLLIPKAAHPVGSLRVGDRVTVRRETNNPYVIFVGKV